MTAWLLIMPIALAGWISVPNLPSKTECDRLGEEIRVSRELPGLKWYCLEYQTIGESK